MYVLINNGRGVVVSLQFIPFEMFNIATLRRWECFGLGIGDYTSVPGGPARKGSSKVKVGFVLEQFTV